MTKHQKRSWEASDRQKKAEFRLLGRPFTKAERYCFAMTFLYDGEEPTTQQEIADHLKMSQPNISIMARKIAEKIDKVAAAEADALGNKQERTDAVAAIKRIKEIADKVGKPLISVDLLKL